MQIKGTGNGQLETPNVPQVRPLGKNGVKLALDSAQTSAVTELSPTELVLALAGFKEVSYRPRHLLHRFNTTNRKNSQERRGSNSAKRKSSSQRANTVDEEDIEYVRIDAAMDALELLQDDTSRDRRTQLEESLNELFDVVGHYDVLAEALERLKDEPIAPVKKIAIKNALEDMMTNLHEKHPHELRRGLQDRDAMLTALQALSGDELGKRLVSTRELRQLIGDKQIGNEDFSLTPLTMLKALIKNFGVNKCMAVLTGLRSRMMIGF